MTPPDPRQIAELLQRCSSEEGRDFAELVPLVYEELRAMAGRQMGAQRRDHTLQATALVNEAWLRIARTEHQDWADRREFLLVAETVMRNVLVDYARRQNAAKRPAASDRVHLEQIESADPFGADLLAMDMALGELARIDERQARIVELRYFAGLSIPETAEALEISESTVTREWRMARAWLKRALA
ncbi:MAG: ECF-type sigma factor [Wenzhouxiangella sp.]